MLLTVYAIIITSAWIIVSLYVIINTRRIGYLHEVPARSLEELPSVAIIIPARNEEDEIEEALTSVLNLNYANKEIIVVNDRSTDSTPLILSTMSRTFPALKLITIKELEEGWLGKNHALYKGYLSTTSDWLLFTDGDVNYAPGSLNKAIAYALEHHTDHLVIIPKITSPSALFKTVMNTFALILEMKLRPWDASNPRSNASIGVGAFNLVKRTAYEKAGTHKAFSLRPDDDLKLGEKVKKAGLKQNVLYGDHEISLKWYQNLSQFVNGLMKNTFSVSHYNLPRAVLNALLAFVVFVLPIPLFLLAGNGLWVYAFIILIAQSLLMLLRKGISAKWYDGLMMTFSGMIMVYIVMASAIKTIKQGGIYWRDHFYALDELKKQRK